MEQVDITVTWGCVVVTISNPLHVINANMAMVAFLWRSLIFFKGVAVKKKMSKLCVCWKH